METWLAAIEQTSSVSYGANIIMREMMTQGKCRSCLFKGKPSRGMVGGSQEAILGAQSAWFTSQGI
jgi:hypothetical protein